jgi:CelD/BcsL family acetyltransferase involved in cellulose biosynthesis
LVAGEDEVGLVYNFIYQKQIFFYLSGLNYGESKKLKPGLVLHSMLIQYYSDRGYDVYNLMGRSSYKKTLAAESIDLISICYQRKRLAFTLENFARNLKSRCQNMLTQN